MSYMLGLLHIRILAISPINLFRAYWSISISNDNFVLTDILFPIIICEDCIPVLGSSL